MIPDSFLTSTGSHLNKKLKMRICHITLKISFLVLVIVMLHSTSTHAQLVHPGGWHTQDDLTLIRTKVAAGEEPWISGWNAIKNTDANENYTANVAPLITGRNDLSDQGHAAYVLAIKWVASGEQKYATAAINIIDAWVNTVEDFDVEGPTLTLSTAGGHLAQAAEIIAHGFNGEAGWPSTSVAKARTWFKNVVYPWTSTGPSRSLNWGTSCVGGNMSMAIFCDDLKMFEDECDAYRYGYSNTDDGCCGVNQYIINSDGQCYESGRDQVHTQGGIAHLFENALCAWNQGVDLVSYSNYRIVAGMEYTSKYNLGNDVSWQSDIENPCNLRYNWTEGISADGRGEWSPMYYMAAKLFTLAGVAHPYTAAVIASPGYAPEPTNTSHPGMGTMCFISSGDHSFKPYLTTEAEDFIAMAGVEITPTTDERAGYKASSIDEGDWMAFEIVIPTSGTFFFDYRVAGGSNGDFKVELNGEAIDTITFNATGGDETWQTVRSTIPVYLNKGVDTFRITSNVAGWNLNWIQLISDCYESTITPRINTIDLQGAESGLIETSEVTIFPGFSVDFNPFPKLYGSWNWTGPNGFSSNQRIVGLSDIQKNQGGDYIAVHTNDCGVESKDTFHIKVQDSLYIEAENYSLMNGVIVEATTDVSGDSNVSCILSESWMEYEVDLPFSALYSFSYRVASENSGSFELSIDSDGIDQVDFNSTGGQTWTTINSDATVYLKAGVQTLRISSNTEGLKINWIQLNALKPVRECMLPITLDGFTVRRETVDWSSGVMDITCESDVDVHVFVEGNGTFNAADYFKVYYKLDNGAMIPVAEKTGALSEEMISAKALVGKTLEVIIQSQTVNSTSRYIISKVLVLKGSDPFARIEAEDYDEAYGTNTETCSDTDGGQNVGSIRDGNWLKYSNINLSEVHSVDLRLASRNSGGSIEVRLDSESGQLIGSVEMPNTGNWQTWKTIRVKLESVIGFYDVYLLFRHPSTYVGNINWLAFSSTTIGTGLIDRKSEQSMILYPNPVNNSLTVLKNRGASLEVYNQLGKLVLNEEIAGDQYSVSLNQLPDGFYVVRILKDGGVHSYKVIKE